MKRRRTTRWYDVRFFTKTRLLLQGVRAYRLNVFVCIPPVCVIIIMQSKRRSSKHVSFGGGQRKFGPKCIIIIHSDRSHTKRIIINSGTGGGKKTTAF